MRAIGSQEDENDEIRYQQRQIKRISVVEALKSLIQKMLSDVLPEAVGGEGDSEKVIRTYHTILRGYSGSREEHA